MMGKEFFIETFLHCHKLCLNSGAEEENQSNKPTSLREARNEDRQHGQRLRMVENTAPPNMTVANRASAPEFAPINTMGRTPATAHSPTRKTSLNFA
jgi:hypothetical protein